MRFRARLVVVTLTTALLVACTAEASPARSPGDAVTRAEAEVLAQLLVRDRRAGGADFVVTAPYREGVVLTLTGEIHFRNGVGRAQAVTSFGTDREDEVRTLFFTSDTVWIGDVAGLPQALAAEGARGATYVRRPMTGPGDDGGPLLTDVLFRLLLDLAASDADDAASFLGPDYTWQGQRSIDSRLATLFGLREDRTVAVGAADDLLLQFVTPLQDGAFAATVTLSDHGRRSVELPADDVTADAADHPDIARQLSF
jgi:hypothetical protein